MADLDDQLLEGGIDLSSEEHTTQINNENSISFDLIENGQSNNADSQTSADSVSIILLIMCQKSYSKKIMYASNFQYL